ncbi:hypothetical protein SDC9_78747 [bioreactor metagenome]|uniref:Uncharacterized protein n=1 Tax=bioreactor metagenome TaxID=1076179 RepID=A0A644YW04_9ZZZZ
MSQAEVFRDLFGLLHVVLRSPDAAVHEQAPFIRFEEHVHEELRIVSFHRVQVQILDYPLDALLRPPRG